METATSQNQRLTDLLHNCMTCPSPHSPTAQWEPFFGRTLLSLYIFHHMIHTQHKPSHCLKNFTALLVSSPTHSQFFPFFLKTTAEIKVQSTDEAVWRGETSETCELKTSAVVMRRLLHAESPFLLLHVPSCSLLPNTPTCNIFSFFFPIQIPFLVC